MSDRPTRERRLIRDGVADEMVAWLQSLLDRIDKVETELREHQTTSGQASTGIEELCEKKRQLETVEQTIELALQRRSREDLDVLIQLAGDLRCELLALYEQLEEILAGKESLPHQPSGESSEDQ